MNRHAKRVFEHLLGPTGSLLLHVIIVIALVRMVFFETGGRAPEVEVIMVEPEEANLDMVRKELQELQQIDAVEAITPPDVSIMTEAPPTDVEEMMTSDQPDVDFAALDIVDTVQSPLVMKGLFQGRTEEGRRKALGTYGRRFAQFTEAAVIRALEWLKDNQEPDGSWAKGSHPGAMTGLGLLTFLAHGETPSSERYGPTVEKAIRWFIERQRPDGFLVTGGHREYAHGIAAYAVAEAYAMTEMPALKEVVEQAIRVIIDGQQEGGGWDYGYKKGDRRDTSVCGWQIQALKAAQAGGIRMPGLQEAMDLAVQDMKWVQGDNGSFGYSSPGGGANMTGVGVLGLQLLGFGDSQEVARGIAFLDTTSVSWEAAGGHALYGWYYITQAKFHHGKSTWDAWNNQFAPEFVKAQDASGFWLAPGNEADHGPVYGTTFAALSLQVYYRLLPTYQHKAVEVRGRPAQVREDEDIVQIL